MSAMLYWKARLADRQPFYDEKLRVEGLNIRSLPGDADPWPRALAREALYDDYVKWFQEVYLAPYLDSGYYRDNPDQLPQAADELIFYASMSPWIYIVGKKWQTRVYPVKTTALYEGEHLRMRKNRYFVRLCTWEDHVAAFELNTGMTVGLEIEVFNKDKALILFHARKRYVDAVRANRDRMSQQMGS